MIGAAWGVTVDAAGGAVVEAPDGYMLRSVSFSVPGFASSTIYYAADVGMIRAPQSDDEATTTTAAGGAIIKTGGGVKGSLPQNLQTQIVLPGLARYVALYANGLGSPALVSIAAELVLCER